MVNYTYFYRYIDTHDNSVKYVGIVYSPRRTLRQRLMEHKNDWWYSNSEYLIQATIIPEMTRTDAEMLEAHWINISGSGNHYNYVKKNWGASDILYEAGYTRLSPHWLSWQTVAEPDSFEQFYTWAIKQFDGQNTPEGDFVHDMKSSKDFPKQYAGHDRIVSYLHVHFACSECFEVFEKMWRQYEGFPDEI